MSRIRRLLASVLTLGMLAMLSHCGDGVLLPDEGVVSNIAIISGNGQSGAAGAPLGQSLVVKITDQLGRPVTSQEVAFSVSTGAGAVAPATAQTDTSGKASAVWTLGPGVGDQEVLARPVGASASLVATFSAIAVAGEGSMLELISGDSQTGPVGSALPESLVVKVTDGLGNPVSGVAVQWSVASGGGSISPETATSGDDGRAAAERVLGPGSGAQSAQASASGFGGSPVTFTHTAVPANPSALVLASGNNQSAPAGFEVAEDLVVRLVDDNGNGIGGKPIAWLVTPGSGSANPTASTTDPNGFASSRWTLGPVTGSNTLNAVFPGLPAVTFTANGTADAPTTMAVNGGDNQTGTFGTELPTPLSVKVTDAHGNPVEGVSVSWTANGSGSVSSPIAATNSDGISEVTRTLGDTPGDYTTTAEVSGLSGSPVTFTSHAAPGSGSKLAFSSGPSNRVVGQPFSPVIKVEIQDANGNLVPSGASVTITSSQTGTLVGTATVNAVAGVATFPNLGINAVGTGYSLTAHSGSLTNAVSDPFDVSQATTTISIASKNPAGTSVVGQQVTVNYDINIVNPGAGSLSGTVTVSDGTTSCNGGINAGTGLGNCQLTFTTAGARSLTATYSGNANFQGSTSGAVSHTVTKANTSISITQDDPDPSLSGAGVTVHWQVTVNSPGAGTPTGTVTVTMNGGETATCNAPVADGQCNLSPAPTVTGTRTITATYSGDGNFNGDSDTESHTVGSLNGAPTANADGYSVNEDQTLNVNPASGVLANDTDPDGDDLDAVVESGPTHAQNFSFNSANGSFSYQPAADFNGTDSFTYHATDGSANSNTVAVTITVNPVNDAPTFSPGANVSVNAVDGAYDQPWASNLSAGPADESGQSLTFNVQLGPLQSLLFSVQPSIDATGRLTFTPSGSTGTANVTVQLQDDGGTANNGDDTSNSVNFDIQIN